MRGYHQTTGAQVRVTVRNSVRLVLAGEYYCLALTPTSFNEALTFSRDHTIHQHLRPRPVFTCPMAGYSRSPPLDPFALAVDDDRCLSAFLVVLRHTEEHGMRHWITSTKELQLTSLSFCAACRDVPTLRLGVSRRIPPYLLSAAGDATAPSAVPPSLEYQDCEREGGGLDKNNGQQTGLSQTMQHAGVEHSAERASSKKSPAVG